MKLKIQYSILISSLLHALLIMLAISNSAEKLERDKGHHSGLNTKFTQGAGPMQFKGVDVEILERKIPLQTPPSITIVENGEVPVLTKKQKPQIVECPGKWYGGLGFTHTLTGEMEVLEVYMGYGADIYGLRAGDIIEWASEGEILGAPGTPIQLIVRRGIEHVTINAFRTKVCY